MSEALESELFRPTWRALPCGCRISLYWRDRCSAARLLELRALRDLAAGNALSAQEAHGALIRHMAGEDAPT